MFLTLLLVENFALGIFGCQVLFAKSSENYSDILKGLDKNHYFFIYGYSNIKEKASFLNESSLSYLANSVPLTYIRKKSNNEIILNNTESELDGVWKNKFEIKESLVHKYKNKTQIHFYYKYSETEYMAILLTTCEFSMYFVKKGFVIRNFFYLFYVGPKFLDYQEREVIINSKLEDFKVFPKYTKYGDHCDLVRNTFNGCPAELTLNCWQTYSFFLMLTVLIVITVVLLEICE